MSSLEFTPSERGFFIAATGVPPPELDTDLARLAAKGLLAAGEMVDGELSPLVEERIAAARLGMSGEMSAAFVAALEQYTTSPPFILPTVSGLARELGAFTIETADQAEAMKIQAIVALAALIVAFLVDAVIAYFDPDLGIRAAVSEWLAVRALLEALLDGLLMRVVEMVSIGIAIQVALDTVAQVVMLVKGIEQTWNWRESLDQVGIGALGGAMGFVLKPAEERVTEALVGLLHDLPGLGRDLGEGAGEGLAEGLGKGLGEGLGDGLGDGAGEGLGEGLGDGAGEGLGKGAGEGGAGKGAGEDLGGGLGGGAGGDGRAAPGGPGDEPAGGHGGGASWAPGRPGPGSLGWWLHQVAEIPVGVLFGGVHNAGHETFWSLANGGPAVWNWGTFAGGSAQAVMHPVAVMTGGGARMVVRVTAPAENLIAAAFGAVTLQHLSDIAAAGPRGGLPAALPGGGLPGGGGEGGEGEGGGGGEKSPPGGAEPGDAEPGGAGPGDVEPGAAGPGGAEPGGAGPAGAGEPAVVRLLRGAGVAVGPEAAYRIAVRTGMVPVTGTEAAHPLYEPVRVTVPALVDPARVAPGVLDSVAGGPVRSLAELPAGSVSPDELASSPPGGLLPPGAERFDGPVPVARPQPADGDSPGLGAGGAGVLAGVGGRGAGGDAVAGAGHLAGGAGGGREVAGSGTPGLAGHGGLPREPGGVPGLAGHGGLPREPGGPGAGGEVRASAGTRWVRGGDGWHVAERDGVLDGVPGAGGRAGVPGGSRAVFDGAGELRHVVLPGGVSYERSLGGAWSGPRESPGEVVVEKTGEPVVLAGRGGAAGVTLPPESERVLDNGAVVAYRQVRDGDGSRLAEPRVFVPDGGGGWERRRSADPASYEAWLAGANQAHDAARSLHDIAARSGPWVPEGERLTGLSGDALRGLLHGSVDDAAAAVYEGVRRDGVALRWTQMSAAAAFAEGKVVNMAAGEGKSWLFVVDAARQAVLPGVDAVHVITTRPNLADREFERYRDLLAPLGFDIHRMNPDSPPPEAAGAGRPSTSARARTSGSLSAGPAWSRARGPPG